MKIAIIGSRNLVIENLEQHILNATEIVSGGAKGVDQCAAEYARSHGILLTEILPNYERYGRAAPILRNQEIVDCADEIVAFWDGKSKGTLSVINYAQKIHKKCSVIRCNKTSPKK